jgi:hypothetical protein
MKNTALLNSDEEQIYEAYTVLGIAAVKGMLSCTTDAANRAVREAVKKTRQHKAFEERQSARYSKVQAAINQAKFDGCFSYRVMSEV